MGRTKDEKKAAKKNERKEIPPLKLPTKRVFQLALILFLVPASYFFVRNSHYFGVKKVRIIGGEHISDLTSDKLLAVYKYRNIFDVDINALAFRIKNDFPIIKKAVVRRVFPDKLEIEIIKRVPVAVVDSYEYFPVDKTAMVLPPDTRHNKLPIIKGLSIWLNPRVGKRLGGKQIESAFALLDALDEVSLPSGCTVTSIDVSNYRDISFYLEDGIEIKIGRDKFADRLKMLRKTLEKPRLNRKNIRYIDLRFKDVVIGPK